MFERSHSGLTLLQVITKLFSSGQHTSTDMNFTQNNNSNYAISSAPGSKYGNHAISRDQFCYTLWKKLKFNVSPTDIDAFYTKYDPNGTGYITMHDLSVGVIKGHNVNEPLLEERVAVNKLQKEALVLRVESSQGLKEFFSVLRYGSWCCMHIAVPL